jgi:glycosyltransferase involved in cell wall biosynthesis
MLKRPLTVVWISEFPVEWLPDLPEPLRTLPRRHPATWQMVLLAEFEKRPDLRVHVVVLRNRLTQNFSFERNSTMFHLLKASSRARVLTLFWLDTFLIRRCLRRIQPCLVHAWGVEHGAALVASRLGRPSVVTMQGLLNWYLQTVPAAHPFQRLMAKLEPVSLRRARVVTTESNFAVKYLQERYPRLTVHQAEHAPNPVFRDVPRQPQLRPLRFVSLGTIDYRKGSDLLLRALARLLLEVEFELILVSGPNQSYLNSLKPGLPAALWERVRVKTHLSPAEVAAELSQAALLILPTRADTSPNAVKEAAVAGVPVVASAVGGIPDYITHGANGLLFPPGDLDGLTQSLREALRHPRFSRGEVEPATWQRVRDYLSPERMAGRFLEAYDIALAQGRR